MKSKKMFSSIDNKIWQMIVNRCLDNTGQVWWYVIILYYCKNLWWNFGKVLEVSHVILLTRHHKHGLVLSHNKKYQIITRILEWITHLILLQISCGSKSHGFDTTCGIICNSYDDIAAEQGWEQWYYMNIITKSLILCQTVCLSGEESPCITSMVNISINLTLLCFLLSPYRTSLKAPFNRHYWRNKSICLCYLFSKWSKLLEVHVENNIETLGNASRKWYLLLRVSSFDRVWNGD